MPIGLKSYITNPMKLLIPRTRKRHQNGSKPLKLKIFISRMTETFKNVGVVGFGIVQSLTKALALPCKIMNFNRFHTMTSTSRLQYQFDPRYKLYLRKSALGCVALFRLTIHYRRSTFKHTIYTRSVHTVSKKFISRDPSVFNNLFLTSLSSTTLFCSRHNLFNPGNNSFIPKRFMQSSTRMVVNKALHTGIRPYASHRVFTPMPKESSNQCLNNNEAITFARKNKAKTVLQHPEWVKDVCIIPGCYGKNCMQLCSDKKKSLSVAHFTHNGERENSIYMSNKDLDYENKTLQQQQDSPDLYIVPYKNPHTTGINSYSEVKDERLTKGLHRRLKELEDQNQDDDT